MRSIDLSAIKSKSFIIAALLALVVVYSLFKLYLINKSTNSQSIQPVLVSVVPVEEKSLNIVVEASGTATPTESVAIKSRIDSQISAIKFHDGDLVSQDQLLFVLDDSALQAQLRQAEATLVRDQAIMTNLLAQYNRVKIIAEKGFESKADLDNAKYQYEAQIAVFNASQAAIENIKTQIGYTKIEAPISGRTGTINITAGNDVKANDVSLATINKITPILIQFSLPEKYLGILRNSMSSGVVEVSIKTADGVNGTLHGMVDYIDNTIDKSTNSFIVRAIYENKKEELWPGAFVSLEIYIGDKKTSVVVPELAIQHSQDGDFVFRVADGKAIKTAIKVDRVQQGLAVIASGIALGEQVVIDGIMNLDDGTNIRLSNQDINKETNSK
jgi:multidrug efflux system membrane fusion protein